ncbi:uncharacterized protein [Taeniopygia guttata]|uniref:uncharacterized protein n=1 Tax=Taeniopygia guttata TaxID=59729 RepID=UPI003BB8AC65
MAEVVFCLAISLPPQQAQLRRWLDSMSRQTRLTIRDHAHSSLMDLTNAEYTKILGCRAAFGTGGGVFITDTKLTPLKLLRVCQCRRNNLRVGEAPSAPPAARPSRRRSAEQRRQQRVPSVGADRARGESSARPGLPAPPARPGTARLGSAAHREEAPAARRAGGCQRPGLSPPPSPPSAADPPPPPPSARGGGGGVLGPGSSRFSAASPRSSPGLPRRAGQDGIAAGSLWEFQGEEICLHLETSAKGEDLLTGQTALAGLQKSYTKNPLEHYIPLFGVWTRVWHSTFTDRCRSLVERRGDSETPTSFSEKKGASGAD